MKNRTLAALLGLSLLANAGLFVAFLARGEKPVAAQASHSPAPVPGTAAAEAHASAGTADSAVPTAKIWERLHSEDERQFAARLREAGVPDRTARLLVAEALRGKYLARQRELIGSAEPADFWKNAAAATDREKRTALRKLARAQQDILTELYGAGDDAAANRERLTRLYGPLPDEKLERVDRIHDDYGDMADDIRAQAGGLLLATDRETLALLEQERRKDVAAILTPAELDLYDMQTSGTARALRARLAAFVPSEKEFRALFALQRDFDERFGGAGGVGDETLQHERATAEAELNNRIRASLGDARYEEYLLQQDPGFRVATRIAERFGLPAKRAAEVFSLSRATQAQLQTLRDDKALAPEMARQSLTKLGRETGERLVALLGNDGAELYKQTSCGAWLRALERVASEPVAAKADSGATPQPSEAPAGSGAPAGPSASATPVVAPNS